MAKIEKCSCEEAEFLRVALAGIRRVCFDESTVPAALFEVVELASEALGDPAPGGEPFCSCAEAIHLRRALRACFNIAQRASASADELAQCSNFADQGLRLILINGDPGVYRCQRFVPRADETELLYLGAANPNL